MWNPKLYNGYKRFIEDLLEKNYSDKFTEQALIRRKLNILYHGVYHPNKLGKMTVTFDRLAEFQRT